MFRKLVKKLDDYLNCKGGLNAQEEELRSLCDTCKDVFPISCLMRDDFEKKGFDTSSLSDEQMARLAAKMGDAYVENDFHSSLETFASLYKVPQKNK